MKFVIVSPRQVCGGPIVLHALCKHLSDMGFDARVFYDDVDMYEKDRPLLFWYKYCIFIAKDTIKHILSRFKAGQQRFPGFYNIPVRGCRRKYLPWVDDDTIVVYPEIIHGNFLHAKNTVRWFLYHNRYKDTPEAYGENDLFVCYREVFNDYDLNPDKLTVRTPYFDLDTYRQYNFGARRGTCYIVRKGKDRPDLPKKFDGIIIDQLPEKEKVRVFNECEYCVSYDTQTAYSGISALCGCISVVIPESGKTRADYRKPEDSSDGIAWGFSQEEINRAVQTRHKLYTQYHELNEDSRRSAEGFVKICKDYFNMT